MDPKKTKNGIDLNQVDVSKMALVDKEGLLNDLGKRLKDEIKTSVTEAVKSVKPEIESIVSDAIKSSQGPSQTPGGTQDFNKSLRDEINDAVSEAVKSVKPDIEDIVSDAVKSQTPKTPPQAPSSGSTPPKSPAGGSTPPPPKPPKPPRQPAQPRQPRQQPNAGGGGVYSDKGKDIADDLDELTEEYHKFNFKELQAAQKRLSDVQESIRATTVGKENSLLTAATAKLQGELANEAKKRGTTLGKIGNFLDRENINAASIITGMFSDSSMVGLMTKGVMEMIRHRRQKQQKVKSDQLKIGDIKQHLPRPDSFYQGQQGQQGQQPPQQQQQPQPQATQPTTAQPTPQEQQQPNRGPAQVHNIGDYADRRAERVANNEGGDDGGVPDDIQKTADDLHRQSKRHEHGNFTREKYDQGYEQGKRAEHERLTKKLDVAKTELGMKESFMKNSGTTAEEDDDPLNGGGEMQQSKNKVKQIEDQLARCAKMLEYIESLKVEQEEAENRLSEYQSKGDRKLNNLTEMPRSPERVQEEPIAQGKAALATREDEEEDSETKLHHEIAPERVPGPDNETTLLKGMKKTEEDESKKLDVFSFRNRNNRINPLLDLRKLSQSQLTELQKMSKIMELQLEQAHLANDAAQRDTKDKGKGDGAEDLVKNMVKKNAEKEGGMGIMDMILSGFEGLRVVQMLKGGLGAVKNVASKVKGKFSKGASKVAKGAEEVGEGSKLAKGVEEVGEAGSKVGEIGKVAEGAGEVGKGAKAVEEAGFMGKLLGKVPGLSKVTGAATKFGKLGKGIVGKAGKGLLHNAGYITTAIDLGIGYATADSISKRTAGLQQDKKASAGDKFGYKAGTAGAYAVGQALGFIPELLGFNRTSDKITGGMLKGETALYKAANEGDMSSDIVQAIKSGDKEQKKKAVKKWGTNFPQIEQVIDIGAANWKKPDWPPGTPENFVDRVLHPEHIKQTPPKKGEPKPGEKKPGEQKPGETKPGEQKPEDKKPEEKKPEEQKAGDKPTSPTAVPPGTPPPTPPASPTTPTPASGAPEPPTPPAPSEPKKMTGMAIAGVGFGGAWLGKNIADKFGTLVPSEAERLKILTEDVKNDGKGPTADANRKKYGKEYSDVLDAAVARKQAQGGAGTPPGTPTNTPGLSGSPIGTTAGINTPGLMGTGPIPPMPSATAAEHVTGTTEPTDDTKKIAQVDLASIGKREDALKVYVVNQVGSSRPSAPTTPTPAPAPPPTTTPSGGTPPAAPPTGMPRTSAPAGPAPIETSLGTGENGPKPGAGGGGGTGGGKPFTPVYTPKRTRELEGKSFAPEKISGDEISTLATKGETGSTAGNPGIVNTKAAAQDAGGFSYGSFQIATKTGTMDKFLDYAKREKPELYERLQKAGGSKAALAGDPGFISEWKALAKDDPKAFHKLQSGFIKETHYDVQMDHLKKAGIDLSGKSNALKNVVFTMSTAEGPHTKTLMQALQGKDLSKMDDKDIINSIYDTKAAKLDKMYSKNGAGLQAGIQKRWGANGQERKDALSMLSNERNPAVGDATKPFSTALSASADNVNKGSKLSKGGDETGAKPTSPTPAPLVASAAKPSGGRGGTGAIPPIGKSRVLSTEPTPAPAPPPQGGLRLATASAQKDNLTRTASAAPPPSSTNLISAPQNYSQTTNILPGVKAQNTESTYQRTMDAMYVNT